MPVTAQNDAPVAGNDSYTTTEGGTLNIAAPGVRANDSDEENDPLTAILVSNVTHGTLTLNADGSFSYTHDGTETLSDSFTYKLNDGALDSNVATVTITVTSVNDAPVAGNDTLANSAEDVAVTVAKTTLLANDNAGPGEGAQTITLLSVGSPTHGTVAISGTNVVFTPTLNYTGPASFQYTIQDNGTTNGSADPKTSTATVNFTLWEVNDLPLGANDSASVLEDNPITILSSALLANDKAGPLTDGDGLPTADETTQTIRISSLGVAGVGSATLAADGSSITYTPPANFSGSVVAVPYRITDNGTTNGVADPKTRIGQSSALITVIPVNDAPTANADTRSMAENSVSTFAASQLTINDSAGPSEGSQILTVTSVQNASIGTVSLSGGNITITPPADYNGPLTFQYTITDDGTTNGSADPLTATGTVTVTVTEVNATPIAGNDAKSTVEDTPFSFPASDLLANDSAGANEAAQTITVTAVSSPVGGTVGLAAGVITFTPTADFFGAASFQYTVTDNGTTNGAADPKSTTATVNVTISEVNDAPVATTDAKSVAEDATLSFPATDLLANDSKGNAFESAQTLTVTSVSNPVGGTVTLVAGTITFTPNADFNGAASFDYAISDDGTTNGAADAKTASGTVNVTVTEINDAPTAVADAKTTAEDVPLSFAASTLTTNDSKGPANEAGQTLTVTAVGSATNGTVSLVAGNITFTPAANFSGSASFQYTVTDDGTTNGAADPKTSSATVTITITEVNDAPVANADAKSTNEDTPLVFPATDLLANDTKGDAFESAQTITVTGVSNPVNGTVSLVAGNITFTPAANFFGTATFDYTITDNGTTNGAADPKSGTGTVTITVVSVNDAPVAVSDSYNVPPAGTLNVAAPGVLANDSDVETPSASLTAILVTNVTEGTLTLNANGSFDYTKAPASVALGDSFTYKVNDGSADSNTVTVSLNFNSPPVAVDDTSYFMVEDQVLTVPAGSGLRVNDSDPDNNITNVIIVSAPANGVLSPTSVTAFGTELPADGSFTYTPQANFFGTDTFTYKLRDAGGLESAPATVSILVNAINDEPTFTAPTTTITLLEDAATYDQPWASAMSPGNAFESAQTINFRAQVTNSALFDNDFQCTPPGIYCSVAVSPVAVDSSTGHVVFKLAANANGTSNVTVDLHDDGGVFSPGDDDTSQPVTFTVNVTPVNDAPTFVKGADQQVDTADGVTRTVNAWAAPSSFSVGPADEVSAGQTITSFSVTNVSDSSFFTTQPAVNQATGTLTFTPVNNAAKTGQVTVTVTITDNGGTANGGANSSSQTFIINFGTAVNANKAPKFNVGTDKTFAAGTTGLQTYTFWATGIDKGAVSESWQTLNFIVDPPSNPSIFTVGGEPAVSPTGTLTFTLSGTTGGSTMVVRLHDDGGTAFGGQDTSAPKTFYIFVGSVNQPPSFTKGPNVTVNEDSAPYSAAWATNINPNAGGSTVSFTVTVDNPALFSVQPTVSSTGVLSFTLAPDAFGSILGSIVAKDDGGTANGGVDTSPAQGFNIFINAVNDPPSFTLSPNPINVAANSGPVTISGWIPTLSYGPANEGTQAPVTFTITQTSTTNPALFTAGPTLDNYVSRNLSFTPADNQSGSATYTIQAKDTGGNANGGNFLSPLVSFTINVTGSGFPVLPAGSGGITAYANIPLSITNDPSDQPYRLLEGATDPIGNELPLTATITQKPVGSIVTIDDPATGAFTFRNGPLSYAAGAISPQQFKYHVCDAGGNCSTERTVVVSFFAPLVFFSDDNAPATATAFGTLDIPVKGMMPGFTDHTAPDATYIIMSGNYSVGPHGTTLGTHIRSGDKVLGQGIAGLTFASLGITDPPVGTLPALPDLSTGTTPSIYATTPWGSGTGSYISDANIGAVFVGLDGGTVKNLNVSEQEEKTGSWLLFAPGGAGYCCTGSPYGTTGNYFFDRVTLANGQGFVIGPEGSSLTLTNSNIRSSAPFGVNNATITITNTPITVDSTGDSTVTRCLFISRTGSGIPVLNVNLTTDAASPITLSNKGYLFDPGSNSSTPIGTYTFNGAVTINRTTAFADGLEIYGRPGHTFAFNGKVDVTVNRGAPLNVHASAVGAGTLTMPNAANTFKLTNATNANVGTAIPFSGMDLGAAGVNLSNLAINGGNLTFTDTAAGAAGPIAVKSGTVKGNGAQQCVIKTNAANVTVDPAVVFTNCTP
ncbi:MAG TPA: Ig-like domain-containing protein [Thermoanaerobaculia bacterium]|nr:Ig-like domain-containing protein [Thermoanaerobaculia bacterium]